MSELVGFDFLTIRKSLESIIIKNLSENYKPRQISSLERELGSKKDKVRSNPLLSKYIRNGSIRSSGNVGTYISRLREANSLLEYKPPTGIAISNSVIMDMPILDSDRTLYEDNYNYFNILSDGTIDLVINNKDDSRIVYVNNGETFLGDKIIEEQRFK